MDKSKRISHFSDLILKIDQLNIMKLQKKRAKILETQLILQEKQFKV